MGYGMNPISRKLLNENPSNSSYLIPKRLSSPFSRFMMILFVIRLNLRHRHNVQSNKQIFIFSHLEGKSVWGHQVQATLVQCGEHSLIHHIQRYDKTKQSKIDDACELAKTMPIPPKSGYALVDSWYTCPKLMNDYAAKGIPTNRSS